MNIFVYDLDHKTNAKYHPDSHIIKMPLEIAQMLSTTYRVLVGDSDRVYKTSHLNHPCTIWMRESYANFMYAIELFYALHDEWNERYGHNKIHASFNVVNFVEKLPKELFPKQYLTPFAQAMDEKYRNSDVVKAYRDYFNGEKLHLAKWKNREVPKWVRL